jgi:hypothetical protein
MKKFSALLSVLVMAALGIACASAKIGDSCEDVGAKSSCPDDALCFARPGKDAVCTLKCKTQIDCPSNSQCVGEPGKDQLCLSNFN